MSHGKLPFSTAEVRQQKNPWSPVEFAFSSRYTPDECFHHLKQTLWKHASSFRWWAPFGITNTFRYRVTPVDEGLYTFEIWDTSDYWKIFGDIKAISETEALIQGTATQYNTEKRVVWWIAVNAFIGFLCALMVVIEGSGILFGALILFLLFLIGHTWHVFLPLRRTHPLIRKIRSALL